MIYHSSDVFIGLYVVGSLVFENAINLKCEITGRNAAFTNIDFNLFKSFYYFVVFIGIGKPGWVDLVLHRPDERGEQVLAVYEGSVSEKLGVFTSRVIERLLDGRVECKRISSLDIWLRFVEKFVELDY